MNRLNLGSGLQVAEGWVNIDRINYGQVQWPHVEGAEPCGCSPVDGRRYTEPEGCRCDAFYYHQHADPGCPLHGLIDLAHDRLPFDDGTVDACVAHHVLDMLTLDELAKVLGEVHRVLVPSGVLRISTPDVEEAIKAVVQLSEREALEWFPMVERGTTSLEKMSHWLTWYGTRKTLLCFEMLEPMLREAGFTQVAYTICGETVYGLRADVCELDSREAESLFMEALA